MVVAGIGLLLGAGTASWQTQAQSGTDLVFLVDDNPGDAPGCDTGTLFDLATNRIVHQGPDAGPRKPKPGSPGRAAFSPDGSVVLSNHMHYSEFEELAPYNIPFLYVSRLAEMGGWTSAWLGGQPLARLGGVLMLEDNDRFLVPLARGDPKAHSTYTGAPYSLAVFRLSEISLAFAPDDGRMDLYALGDPVAELEVSGIPIAMWRSADGEEVTAVTHDGAAMRLGIEPLMVRSTQPIPAFRDNDRYVAEVISKASATLSRDGRWLVSTRWDAGEIILTDLERGAQTVYEVPFGRGRVGGVAFSHTGGSADILAVHARSSVEFYRLRDSELVYLGGQRIIPPSYPTTDDCFNRMSPDKLCGQLAQPLTWSSNGHYVIAGASSGSAEYAILEVDPADGSSSKPRYIEVCRFGGDGPGWNGAAVAVSSNGAQYTPSEIPPTSTALPTSSATSLPTGSPTSTPTLTSTPTPVAATDTPLATATPTPTASATREPTASGPTTVYLPLALIEFCPPRELFTDIVLVIDASTSMRDLTADGRRKVDVATEAAEVFIAGLRLDSARDRVAIISFNESAETLQRLTDSSERAVAALSRIRTAEQSRVDRGVERATVELVARGRPGHVHAMVVLSDGKVNEVGRDQPGIAARGARRAGITVYVVGMGPSMDEQVLREMAGQADRYYPAPAPHLIRAIYSDLSERVPCPPSAYWGRR